MLKWVKFWRVRYTEDMQWLTKFMNGFVNAFKGIGLALAERNMRIHVLAFVTVMAAGFYFQISPVEWAVIVVLSAAVMAAEIANTAIESVCNVLRDTLKTGYESTRQARDLAAGSVLTLAIAAVLIAGLIFGPRILTLMS